LKGGEGVCDSGKKEALAKFSIKRPLIPGKTRGRPVFRT